MTNTFLYVLLFSVIGQIHGETNYRIFHGDNATIGEFPYTAIIYFKGGQYCGASIISEDILVTAAHCANLHYSKYTVSVGTDNCKKISNARKLSALYIHEDYYGNEPQNDIALFKLSKKLKFGENIKPVALPIQNYYTSPRADVRLAGCGNTYEYREHGNIIKTFAEHLWEANLQVGSCANLEPNFDFPTLFCASNEKHSTSCHGDSGAGYVEGYGGNQYFLVGVESQGPSTCGHSYVSAGTIVGRYTNWIVKTIKALKGSPPIIINPNNN